MQELRLRSEGWGWRHLNIIMVVENSHRLIHREGPLLAPLALRQILWYSYQTDYLGGLLLTNVVIVERGFDLLPVSDGPPTRRLLAAASTPQL